jgi:UDP-N-acetylmuramate--alanine ligase
VANALPALCVARHFGVNDGDIGAALAEFRGVARRMETIGVAGGVRVVDDYAHNPFKVAAAAAAAKCGSARVIGVYQPHGFGPTAFMMDDFARAFAESFSPPHRLYLLPIYDAGGTANRSVSSEDLAARTAGAGGRAQCVRDRAELVKELRCTACRGDTVLVMGARDPTLTDLCREIVAALEE